jgi:peptidase E
MDFALQPIYLFADSQLLFWNPGGGLFLNSVRGQIDRAAPKAAYLGASNGDDPRFYSIFEAAMGSVGIRDCRMVLSSFSSADESFLNESDIILLAGGSVERGWNVFNEVGLKEAIIRRYYEGALLIGISAGAVQLGMFGVVEEEKSLNRLIDTFKLVPFIISAHEEDEEWESLRETIQLLGGPASGIGIPSGGGMIYYPDQTVEAVRRPLYEFSVRDGVATHNLLIPNQEP